MSGVRVRDQELLRLGMTLPGFVERGRVIASLPSLGLLTIAGCTPSHWEVVYREADEAPEVEGRYDLVAISSLSARILEAYALADRLRAAGTKVVLGGLHVSALPREAMAHADAVVQGEGEAVWPTLLRDLEEGSLRPLYSSFDPSNRAFRIEDAPIPRYDLLDPSRYNRLPLQTTRGCPLDCSFCAASRLISPYRRKPIERIRREMEAILAIWPRPFIELADDNTFVDKRWGKELSRLLAAYPVRWFTETDLSVAADEELLDLLADSGCAQLLIGLESARRESLRGVDGRDWKHSRWEEYAEKIGRIQSRGISVNGCFVLGFDGDDAGVFERTREFVREIGLAEVQVTILTPFPGTALYDQMEREGRLLSPVYWDRCTLFDLTFRPSGMGVDELERGFRNLMVELYGAEEVARRKRLFRGCVRAARRR